MVSFQVHLLVRRKAAAKIPGYPPASGPLPDDPKKIEKILSVAPAGSRPKP